MSAVLQFGGSGPPRGITPHQAAALGDTLPGNVKASLANIRAVSEATRELTDLAADGAAKLLALHIDAQVPEGEKAPKGIRITFIARRDEEEVERCVTVATLSSPLLRQLFMKAVADGAKLMLVEPASMLRDANLLAKEPTPVANRFVDAMWTKTMRQNGQ